MTFKYIGIAVQVLTQCTSVRSQHVVITVALSVFHGSSSLSPPAVHWVQCGSQRPSWSPCCPGPLERPLGRYETNTHLPLSCTSPSHPAHSYFSPASLLMMQAHSSRGASVYSMLCYTYSWLCMRPKSIKMSQFMLCKCRYKNDKLKKCINLKLFL